MLDSHGETFIGRHVVIALVNPLKPNLKVLAIISCKTSLRDRLNIVTEWKKSLLKSEKTKHIKLYLFTADNDKDFDISPKRKSPTGKSGIRLTCEKELDGVYIVRGDFKEEWESEKVKRYEKIADDLVKLVKEGKAPM